MKALYISLTFTFLAINMLAFDNKGVPLSDGSHDTVTICNPMDLSYRFCLDKPSRREAADPFVLWFKDRYYLFASKSGGYWHSKSLAEWTFVESAGLPIEDYAPTVIAIKDTLYFMASSNEKIAIYKSTEPLTGRWSLAHERPLARPLWDPAFLFDDDRLYLYWGSSDVDPIYGVEIDYRNNFAFIGTPTDLIHSNPDLYGWEVPGDYNTLRGQRPWIEGASINKINGRYYLQYSAPGTEYKSYADGVYTSENPLGPYKLQSHNPFAYKPEGFAAAAGHGCVFADRYGNLWHIGTMTISVKHVFERRLGLFPVFIDKNGTLYSNTRFGDYPLILPQKKISSIEDIFPGWMPLSYARSVKVSSAIDSCPASNMTDEEIRTYWAAKSGGEGEFAILDLKVQSDVHAIQINFAEHNTAISGRQEGIFHRYTVESSNDGVRWEMLLDKSRNESDNSHVYIQLPCKVRCRFLKIKNIEVPGGCFAISDLRVFGKGNGERPGVVKNFVATRDPLDRRSVHLKWDKSGNAIGYNIRYGITKDGLYNNYQVYSDTSLTINSLDTGKEYYFTIEAFNQNGITINDIITLPDQK